MTFLRFVFCLGLCAIISAGATATLAQDTPQKGRVTNLPLPRYVSMKAQEGNARRGPDVRHRIDWVFSHQNMPLQIVDEFEHWRRVLDVEGQGGWMHFRLLSGVRTVVFVADSVKLYKKPDRESEAISAAERGAIAYLDACQPDWCRVSQGRLWGWVEKTNLWGVGAAEVIN